MSDREAAPPGAPPAAPPADPPAAAPPPRPLLRRDAYRAFIRELEAEQGLQRTSLLLLVILAFILVAFVWAWLTEIDEVTRGEGRVVPSRQVQQVQSLEGGILKELRVRQGQKVEVGDILVVLDEIASSAEMNQLRQRQLSLSADIQRLTAEVQGRDLILSADIRATAPTVAEAQRRLFDARRQELRAELGVLEQQLQQRRRELQEATVDLATTEDGLGHVRREIGLVEPMVRRGIEPKMSLLQLEKSLAQLTGQRDGARIRIDRLGIAVREVADRKSSLTDRYRSEALQQLSRATAELAEVMQNMPAKADRVARAEVRSPVRGIVNQVHLTTIGGVARPGEPLVGVVPVDDVLLVEANIRPSDIAFLRPGQRVKVKLTAYDFARYGALDGRLLTIGADAVQLPESGQTAYPVRVEVDSMLHDAAGQPLDIVPGMVAQVDVLTGRRTVLQYLLQPVVKVRDVAFRER